MPNLNLELLGKVLRGGRPSRDGAAPVEPALRPDPHDSAWATGEQRFPPMPDLRSEAQKVQDVKAAAKDVATTARDWAVPYQESKDWLKSAKEGRMLDTLGNGVLVGLGALPFVGGIERKVLGTVLRSDKFAKEPIQQGASVIDNLWARELELRKAATAAGRGKYSHELGEFNSLHAEADKLRATRMDLLHPPVVHTNPEAIKLQAQWDSLLAERHAAGELADPEPAIQRIDMRMRDIQNRLRAVK